MTTIKLAKHTTQVMDGQMIKVFPYWKPAFFLLLFTVWVLLFYGRKLDEIPFGCLLCLFILVNGCVAKQERQLRNRCKKDLDVT